MVYTYIQWNIIQPHKETPSQTEYRTVSLIPQMSLLVFCCTILPDPQLLATTDQFYITTRMSYQWNHVVYNYLVLSSFTFFLIHVPESMVCSFLLVSIILLCGTTIVCPLNLLKR